MRPSSATESHIIVGAGQAGAYAAIAMRRAGFGGRIVLIGDEPQAPYDRTPLSKSFLIAAKDVAPTRFYDPQTYDQERIDVQLGTRVESIDPASSRIRITGGKPMHYDRLVLACGSRARSLSIPGAERILTLRTSEDAALLRRRLLASRSVVCIGAGVIGLEIASAARAQGCAAIVVEREAGVMSRSLAPQLAEHVVALHRRAGVQLLFGNEVVAVEAGSVILQDGSRLDADTVVAGIGVKRNTAIAAAAGISIGRGILTDAGGRTSVERIYGAGEVAECYSPRLQTHIAHESWRHAQDHGAFVGRVTAGTKEIYDEVPWFWSDQHGSNIQVAGNARGAERMLVRGDSTGASFSVFLLDSADRLTGAFGMNAGRDVSAAIRLMRRGGRVDPDILTDSAVSPQRLLATALVPDPAA